MAEDVPIPEAPTPRRRARIRRRATPIAEAAISYGPIVETPESFTTTLNQGGPNSTTMTEPPTPQVRQVAQNIGITSDPLIDALRALGAELRRPDPEVEAEKAAEKMRLRRAKEAERTVILEQQQKIKAFQAACAAAGHRQNGGKSQQSAISGQITSDGLWKGICVCCQQIFVRKPTSDEMSNLILN